MPRRIAFASVAALAAAAAVMLGGVFSDEKAPPQAASADTLVEQSAASLDRARQTGDFSHLARADRTVAEAERRGGVRADTLAVRAALANYRHRFAAGLALASRALALEPENAHALGSRADALFELGRYREAVRAFDHLVELVPEAPAYTRAAQARQLLGRSEAAVEAAELAVEAATGDPKLEAFERVYLASLLVNGGRLDRGEAEYRRALESRPGYAAALAGLGDVAEARGDLRRAAALFRRALARTPSASYAASLAAVLARLGDARAAAAAYAVAERRGREFAAHGGRDQLGSALLDLDRDVRVRDALRRAREGRRLRPSIEGDHVLAWALYKNGRCGEARAFSVRALRFGTADLDAIYHRSLIERCLGNVAESRRFLERLRELNPYYLAAPPSARRLPSVS
jgi:tetratricopeptide (TPR) repeat protein